ncbi:hypothetical protein ACM7HI_01955 [Pseudomonas aeruginosa]
MITNNSKAPSCTCPSGDGSLVHPCPAHPASVKQAGGDERAAFEAWATHLPMDRQYLRPDLYMPPTQWAWDAWQARAALAQPSPAPTLRAAIDVANDRFEVPVAKWGTDLAEAERPEQPKRHTADVFYHNHFSTVQMEVVRASDFDEFAAQHERIVGSLRAKADQLSEALEWRKENQAGQRELLRSVTAERDAALARVAELETALTPFSAVADAYDDSEDDDHEPYTDMGCDDRLRLTLSQHRAARTALSGAPSNAQHSVPDDDTILQIFADNAEHSERGGEPGRVTRCVEH